MEQRDALNRVRRIYVFLNQIIYVNIFYPQDSDSLSYNSLNSIIHTSVSEKLFLSLLLYGRLELFFSFFLDVTQQPNLKRS